MGKKDKDGADDRQILEEKVKDLEIDNNSLRKAVETDLKRTQDLLAQLQMELRDSVEEIDDLKQQQEHDKGVLEQRQNTLKDEAFNLQRLLTRERTNNSALTKELMKVKQQLRKLAGDFRTTFELNNAARRRLNDLAVLLPTVTDEQFDMLPPKLRQDLLTQRARMLQHGLPAYQDPVLPPLPDVDDVKADPDALELSDASDDGLGPRKAPADADRPLAEIVESQSTNQHQNVAPTPAPADKRAPQGQSRRQTPSRSVSMATVASKTTTESKPAPAKRQQSQVVKRPAHAPTASSVDRDARNETNVISEAPDARVGTSVQDNWKATLRSFRKEREQASSATPKTHNWHTVVHEAQEQSAREKALSSSLNDSAGAPSSPLETSARSEVDILRKAARVSARKPVKKLEGLIDKDPVVRSRELAEVLETMDEVMFDVVKHKYVKECSVYASRSLDEESQRTLLICFNDVVVICRERRKHFVTVNGNQVPQLRELARYNLIDMSIKLDDDDVSHAILSSTGLGPSSVHVVFNNGSDCVKWVGIMHDNQLVLQKDKRLGVKAR